MSLFSSAVDVLFLTALRPARTLEGLWKIPGAPKMGAMLYSAMRKTRLPRCAAIVFCDIERLGAEQEDQLAALARHWASSTKAPLMLNRPPGALRRYPLMKALKAAGVNRADVARLDDHDGLARLRFPCFVRYENGHIDKGRAPALVESANALQAHMAAMRAAGETLYGKIAIEYEPTRDDQGHHVKYSYFCVGDALIPGHRFVGEHWFVKAASADLLARRPDLIAAERDYLQTAPFKQQIAKVFEIAGVNYGRVDFGVRDDGALHIFEINTNPRHPLLDEAFPARRELVAAAKANLGAAFNALMHGRERVALDAPRGAI